MWLKDNFFSDDPFTEDDIGNAVGFVYLICNRTNGKSYVGKKLFTRSKTYQKNKKRKKTRVASNWITYTGSNEALNNDIAAGHKIEKYILHLCESKGWMSYLETKEIIDRNCLLSDHYYNDWFSCKVRRSHLKRK